MVGSFSGSMSNTSRAAAETSGAVGLVLLVAPAYVETYSPGSWNFKDFPGIVVWGPTSYQVKYDLLLISYRINRM